MTIIKNGCICGKDYYTTTEQCDDPDCRSARKSNPNYKKAYELFMDYFDYLPDEDKIEVSKKLEGWGL